MQHNEGLIKRAINGGSLKKSETKPKSVREWAYLTTINYIYITLISISSESISQLELVEIYTEFMFIYFRCLLHTRALMKLHHIKDEREMKTGLTHS
jgi:hypothetical protein